MKNTSVRREGNIAHIQKPGKTYTVLYGFHIVSQNPKEIPENTQAIFLETGMFRWAADPVKSLYDLREHVQYKRLFERIEKERIPVIFGDPKYKQSDALLLLADNAFTAMGWMAGVKLLQSARRTLRGEEGDEGNKRNGVGKATLLTLAGAWMLLPFASSTVQLFSSITGVGLEQSAELKKLSHKLHPEAELLYLTLRNTVIAEKEDFLANVLDGRNTHMTTVLGAGHVGIEDSLQKSSEERIQYLRHLQPLLKKIAIPEYFYQIAKMEFTGKEWKVGEILEVPALKQLVTS